jgi:ABC-type nitrate/sulfonate/bicarbonate transport system ATPase subunit
MELKLERVEQRVGAEAYLYPLDLTLVPRAVTVLLGATQAGKTTLLRVMAGLDAPARETDLAGMVLQVITAPRQQHGQALRPFDQRHQHCGPRQQTVRQHVGVEVVIAAAQTRGRGDRQAGEDVIPAHAAGSLRPSGKNCSLLHTPYTSSPPMRRICASSTSS